MAGAAVQGGRRRGPAAQSGRSSWLGSRKWLPGTWAVRVDAACSYEAGGVVRESGTAPAASNRSGRGLTGGAGELCSDPESTAARLGVLGGGVKEGGRRDVGQLKGGRRGSWGCAPVVIPAGIAARPLQRGENGGGGADWWGHGVSGAGRRRAMRATRWRAGPGEQAGASACWAAREAEAGREAGRAERGQAGDEAGRAEQNRPGWSGPGEPSAGPRAWAERTGPLGAGSG